MMPACCTDVFQSRPKEQKPPYLGGASKLHEGVRVHAETMLRPTFLKCGFHVYFDVLLVLSRDTRERVSRSVSKTSTW